MGGYLLPVGATVMCSHGGQAAATSPNPSVTLNGVPTVLLNAQWVVAGCPLVSQLDAFGVAPVELALHECRDVDVVDDEVADEPGQADVHEPRVSDLDLAQVTVPEVRAGEVSGLLRLKGRAQYVHRPTGV